MPLAYVRQGGLFKSVNQIYVHKGGSWAPLNLGYVRQNGIWKQFYPATTGYSTVYNNPGIVNTFTVPAGVTQLSIVATGASGGTGGNYASGTTAYPGGNGGSGQTVTGT